MAEPLPTYPMKEPLGYGIIIVNTFANTKLCRKGSDQETNALLDLFTKLGLQIKLYQDMTSFDMLELLLNISRDPELFNHSIIMLAISSHGSEQGFFGINIEERLEKLSNNLPTDALNDTVFPMDIQEMFNSENCKALIGKPKVFIFNGCRGKERETYFYTDDFNPNDSRAQRDTPSQSSTVWSDFLIIWSTLDGYVSLRNIETGSIFLNVFTDLYIKFITMPLESILPLINYKLIEKTRRYDNKRQTLTAECCISQTTLTKSLLIMDTKQQKKLTRLSSKSSFDDYVLISPCDSSERNSLSSLNSSDMLSSITGKTKDFPPLECITIQESVADDVINNAQISISNEKIVWLLEPFDDQKKNLLLVKIDSHLCFVPRTIIKRSEKLEDKPWFYCDISKSKATCLLQNYRIDGSFILRKSLIESNTYRLILYYNNAIFQFTILYLTYDWIYLIGNHNFNTLLELVQFCTYNKILKCKLNLHHPFKH